MVVPTSTRASAAKQGRTLEYFTILWNSVEGLLGVIAGALAGSISLIAFGADSFIEVTSASALLWRISVDQDAPKRERNERLALRIVGVCFLALAIYVLTEAIRTILSRRAPEHSPIGIAVAIASLIAMPLLSRAKRRVAAELGSGAMKADSRQTDFCAYLSAILLIGLASNWLLAWWWADPIAALIMTPIIAHEGIESLRGRQCAECHSEAE